MRRRASLPPLTHHDMLRAASPLLRAGHHVDLTSTDRAARRIGFKAVEEDGISHVLELDVGQSAAPRIRRVATDRSGLTATYELAGGALEALLEQLRAIAPADQFREVDGLSIAESYALDLKRSEAPRLVACNARLATLDVHLDAKTVIGEPMTLRLTPRPGRARPQLPDDVLAILGRDWQPLLAMSDQWKSAVRGKRHDPARTIVARERFTEAVRHLADVLAGSPADYHARFGTARWWAFLRRSQLILGCIAAIACLPVIDAVFLSDGRVLHPLFQLLPPVMICGVAAAWWREMPRFEIPPRPRPLAIARWDGESAAPGAVERGAA